MNTSREPGAASVPSARRLATRERLQTAAAEVFAEESLQGASVESICTRAGFTRGAFYSNFASKEELFLSLLEREFARRAAELETKTAELSPALRSHDRPIDPALAAEYIAAFLAPTGDAEEWLVLESEFALLAMRDPSSAPGYIDLLTRYTASMADLVAAAIGAAGRRFVLPAEHAIAILTGEYERALRTTAIGGPGAPGGLDELPSRISDVLFAITEPLVA